MVAPSRCPVHRVVQTSNVNLRGRFRPEVVNAVQRYWRRRRGGARRRSVAVALAAFPTVNVPVLSQLLQIPRRRWVPVVGRRPFFQRCPLQIGVIVAFQRVEITTQQHGCVRGVVQEFRDVLELYFSLLNVNVVQMCTPNTNITHLWVGNFADQEAPHDSMCFSCLGHFAVQFHRARGEFKRRSTPQCRGHGAFEGVFGENGIAVPTVDVAVKLDVRQLQGTGKCLERLGFGGNVHFIEG